MQKHPVRFAILGVLAVAFGWLIFRAILAEHNENVSKQLLAQEVSRLPVPQGCAEHNRLYERGSVDITSSWQVTYKCAAAQVTVQKGVTQQLLAQRYQYGPSDGTFQNQDFFLTYNFSADSPSATTFMLTIARTSRTY